MDRLFNLRVFIRLAETLNFSEAAATLQIARSSVSKAVQDIESEVGVRLVHRSTRKVSLTPNGAVFYRKCVLLVRDADALSTMFDAPVVNPKGRLRVSVPTRIGRLLLAPELTTFFDRFPEIELDLASTDRPVDLIGEGFDCVIRVGEQKDSGLVSRKLGELAMMNCASPDYLARKGEPKKLADLSKHSAVGYVSVRNKRDYGWEYMVRGQPKTMQMPCSVRVNNAELYIACCLSGLGLIQVPAFDVREAIATGHLIEVLPRHPSKPMPISIVSPDRSSKTPAVDAFANWAGELIEQLI